VLIFSHEYCHPLTPYIGLSIVFQQHNSLSPLKAMELPKIHSHPSKGG
jgi:hypothetical protein